MFYSTTLFQTQGSLARVWLSANMERKLSKAHVLQQDLRESVDAIMAPSQAPLALRLTSHLLIGAVRIYSRKARYLMDDCTEALIKIKLAFRSTGNNDMPTSLTVSNPETLRLPDRITPHDNLDLPPPPDVTFLLSQIEEDAAATPNGKKGRVNRDINLQEDFSNSQFLENGLGNEENLALEDDLELEIDFGNDDDLRPARIEQSIEIGREAPEARPVEDDLFSEMNFPTPRNKDKDRAEPEPSLDLDEGVRIADEEGDVPMLDDDMDFALGDSSTVPALPNVAETFNRARISESPLSDMDEDFAKEVEIEYSRIQQTDMYEQEEEEEGTEAIIALRPPPRARKQKLLVPDLETVFTKSQMMGLQSDRSAIVKPSSFLPRDPYLLALAEMQKSGGFVSSVLMDARSATWAPELRGMLSLDTVRSGPVNDLKRKRDSGIADMESDQGASKSPRLDVGDEDLENLEASISKDVTVGPDGTLVEIPADETLGEAQKDQTRPEPQDEEENGVVAFDETTAPIVHPQDSGPVSISTTHAVHILRGLFGDEAEHNEELRRKQAVVFQDLLPERQTSKADATKMFFECLVLATKDAVKVDQGPELGARIQVRGKRGLWGAWAEREAGGGFISQDEPEVPTAGPNIPSEVSVEA